jgi:hypothetical protein
VSAKYYCWLCGAGADHRVPGSSHYEKPLLLVRFCSEPCRAGYLWLKSL